MENADTVVESSTTPEYFDVVVVGAGISGIDAAYHLTTHSPQKSFVVLDALESFGGTWRTHKYPGVRSDSDLYTFGYGFKPWTNAPIASAEQILSYLGEVIDDNDLAGHFRYRHSIHSASWSSDENAWTLLATDEATGTPRRFTTNFSGCARAITATPRDIRQNGPDSSDSVGRWSTLSSGLTTSCWLTVRSWSLGRGRPRPR